MPVAAHNHAAKRSKRLLLIIVGFIVVSVPLLGLTLFYISRSPTAAQLLGANSLLKMTSWDEFAAAHSSLEELVTRVTDSAALTTASEAFALAGEFDTARSAAQYIADYSNKTAALQRVAALEARANSGAISQDIIDTHARLLHDFENNAEGFGMYMRMTNHVNVNATAALKQQMIANGLDWISKIRDPAERERANAALVWSIARLGRWSEAHELTKQQPEHIKVQMLSVLMVSWLFQHLPPEQRIVPQRVKSAAELEQAALKAEADRIAYKAEKRSKQQQRRAYMGWEFRDPASYQREDSIEAITAADFATRRSEVITGLKDPDANVRWTAVRKFGELGNKDDLARLLPLIDDKKLRNIQTAVIDAIVKFQAKEHSDLIAKKLSKALPTDALSLLEALRKLDVVEKHAAEITPLIDQKNADVRCRTILLLSYSNQPIGVERISCRISDDTPCTVPSKPASTNFVASTVQDVARNALLKWNVEPECSKTTKTDRSAQIVVFDQKTGKYLTKQLANGRLEEK